MNTARDRLRLPAILSALALLALIAIGMILDTHCSTTFDAGNPPGSFHYDWTATPSTIIIDTRGADPCTPQPLRSYRAGPPRPATPTQTLPTPTTQAFKPAG